MKKLQILFLFWITTLSPIIAQSSFINYYGDSGSNNFEHAKYDSISKAYYAVGSHDNKPSISKIGSDGKLIWTKDYGNKITGIFYDFVLTQNGDLIVVGDFNTNATSASGIMVFRVNTNGEEQWSNNTNLFLDATAMRVVRPRIVSNQENIYISYLRDTVTTGGRIDKFTVISLDSNGTSNWVRSFGTDSNVDDQVYDMTILGDMLFFSGNPSSAQNANAYIGAITESGSLVNIIQANTTFPASRFLGIDGSNGLTMVGSNDNSSLGNGIICSATRITVNVNSGTALTSIVKNGNYTFAASTSNINSPEVYIFDSDNRYVSSQRFSDVTVSPNYRISVTSNNRVILCGSTQQADGFGGRDAFLAVVNPFSDALLCNAVQTKRQFVDASYNFNFLTTLENPVSLNLSTNHSLISENYQEKEFCECNCKEVDACFTSCMYQSDCGPCVYRLTSCSFAGCGTIDTTNYKWTISSTSDLVLEFTGEEIFFEPPYDGTWKICLDIITSEGCMANYCVPINVGCVNNVPPPDNLIKQLSNAVPEMNNIKTKLNLFPNPSNGNLTLSFDESNDKSYTVQIFNLNGALISEQRVRSNSNHEINITESGIYFLHLLEKGNLIKVQKLVIQK